jgi:hypothetical protein
VRRHEPPEPHRAAHDPPPRDAEPLPAEATVLGLQRAAGNRAVSAMLARQPAPADSGPKPRQDRAATSTVGLGEEIGVIPLDSATLGQADRDGNVHDLHVSFVNNPAVAKIQQAMLTAKPIPEGFYSSTSMKLTLANIVITSMTFSDGPDGEQLVSLSLNFSSSAFEKAH